MKRAPSVKPIQPDRAVVDFRVIPRQNGHIASNLIEPDRPDSDSTPAVAVVRQRRCGSVEMARDQEQLSCDIQPIQRSGASQCSSSSGC